MTNDKDKIPLSDIDLLTFWKVKNNALMEYEIAKIEKENVFENKLKPAHSIEEKDMPLRVWSDGKAKSKRIEGKKTVEETLKTLKDSEDLFKHKIFNLVSENALNQEIDAISVADQRSLLTYDCMKVLSSIDLDNSRTITIMGIPITGTIKDLLRLSEAGQSFSMSLLSSSENCECLALLPYYMGGAFSPQSLGDVLSSCVAIFENNAPDKNLVTELRNSLLPYSIASHLDLLSVMGENDEQTIEQPIGTAIMMMAVLNLGPENYGRMKEWMTENNFMVLAGKIAPFYQATVEGIIQHSQYEWGVQARENQNYNSVLAVNHVSLEKNIGEPLLLKAFVDDKIYGQAKLEDVCLIWATDLVMHELETRGVHTDTQKKPQNK